MAARIWLGIDLKNPLKWTEYWTGVNRKDLEEGKVKFVARKIASGMCYNNPENRRETEERSILRFKPYLQFPGPFQKYPSFYSGLDLCIHPWNNQRRNAYLTCLRRAMLRMKEGETVEFVV